MLTSNVFFLIGGLLLLGFVLSGCMLWGDLQRDARLDRRVRAIHGLPPREGGVADIATLRDNLVQAMAGVGRTILRSGMISRKTLSDLEKTLSASGMNSGQGVGAFIGCKVVLVVAIPLIVWIVVRDSGLSAMVKTLLPLVAGIAAMLAPDMLISKHRARYLLRLEEGLPDALDMMVICAQAGLGLGPAVIKVAHELRISHKELAFEFAMMANELQILADSRIALSNIGARTDLESLKRLGSTLIQSAQYGTPLTDALRSLSTELRHELMVKLETKAARLPVMLTMPMIVFILPCVFLIAGGPAMIQVTQSLK